MRRERSSTCGRASYDRARPGWPSSHRPNHLRHAFASLQIRAGLSISELAEQMGHSPAMTLGTYAHVIRELNGEPVLSAEEQIERARRDLPGRFRDVGAAEADGA